MIWAMLPDFVKVRTPKPLYCTHTDGFNIINLYNQCADYRGEYKFVLLIIQTNKDQIFGAFVDDVPKIYSRGYVGTNDSFVFTVKPEAKPYYDNGANSRYFFGQMDYFSIGGEG